MKHDELPNETQMIHTDAALPFANIAEARKVATVNEQAQDEHHVQKPNAGDRQLPASARGGISVRGPAPRKRPRTLDEALKVLAESLD